MKMRKGFTLIELLLVIAVIVALAVTVFVALNPAGRLANARDARRTSDVDTLLTAVHEYILDNSGTIPSAILTSTDAMIGFCTTAPTSTGGSCNVVTGTACFPGTGTNIFAAYLKTLPSDPLSGSPTTTQYAITVSATSGILTVKACGVEKLSQIWASR